MQMCRWMAGYICGVCGREGKRRAVEMEMDHLYTKEISQEQNTTNIIVMVLKKNDNT